MPFHYEQDDYPEEDPDIFLDRPHRSDSESSESDKELPSSEHSPPPQRPSSAAMPLGTSLQDKREIFPPDDLRGIKIGKAALELLAQKASAPWQKAIFPTLLGHVPHELRPVSEQRPFPHVRTQQEVATYFDPHLKCLFEAVPKSAVKAKAGAQLVNKPVKDGKQVSRFITDGRVGNILLKKEAKSKLRFCFIPYLLELLALLLPFPDIAVVDGDLRHFYFQLAFPYALSLFFAICVLGTWYRPLAVPMGFTNSSLWGQTVTLSMLLAREIHQPLLGINPSEALGDVMPRVLHLYEEFFEITAVPLQVTSLSLIGFIAVLMDGFIIVVRGSDRARRWQERVFNNCKTFNLILKPINPKAAENLDKFLRCSRWEPPSSTNWNSSSVIFNGIEFRGGEHWGFRPDKPPPALLSKPISNRSLPVLSTPRLVTSILGKLNWQLRIHGVSPLEYASLMKLWSRYTPTNARDKRSWSVSISVPPEDLHQMSLASDLIPPRHIWCQPIARGAMQCTIICISDAFTKGTGFVLMDPFWNILALVHVDEDLNQATAELKAMIDAAALARFLAQTAGFRSILVIIAGDADYARAAIEKGSSPRPEYIEQLERLHILKEDFPMRIRTMRIPGDHNLGDIMSRRSSKGIGHDLCRLHRDDQADCHDCLCALWRSPRLPNSVAFILSQLSECSFWGTFVPWSSSLTTACVTISADRTARSRNKNRVMFHMGLEVKGSGRPVEYSSTAEHHRTLLQDWTSHNLTPPLHEYV